LSDIEETEHHQQFITLKFKSFAILKDIIGTQQITFQITQKQGGKITVSDLKKRILDLYPEISAQKITFAIAVNAAIANDKSVINDFDEIALLPPISGGNGFCFP
jgi:molybdopterin synthase sulfur carrier subunit